MAHSPGFLVGFVVVGMVLLGTAPAASSPTPQTQDGKAIAELIGSIGKVAANAVRTSKPDELLEGARKLRPENVTAEHKPIFDSIEAAAKFAKEKPEAVEAGRKLLSTSIEEGSKFISERPELVAEGVKFLQENPEVLTGIAKGLLALFSPEKPS